MRQLAILCVLLGGVAMAADPLVETTGDSADRFGEACIVVGDLNDDGTPDFAVGASRADNGTPFGPGLVTIHDGATGDPMGIQFAPQRDATNFGKYLALVSDLDMGGDGRNDLFIAAPGDSAGATPPGHAVVVSLDDFTEHIVMYGRSNTGHFGTSVADIGDVNGDDVSDLVVGEPGVYGSSPGAAWVVSGATGETLEALSMQDFDGGGNLGWSVTGLGDVDGDGTPDYAAGAPNANNIGTSNRGKVQIMSTGFGTLRTIRGGIQKGGGGKVGDFLGYSLDSGRVTGAPTRALVAAGVGGGGFVRVYAVEGKPGKKLKPGKLPKPRKLSEHKVAFSGYMKLVPSMDGRAGMDVLLAEDNAVSVLSFGSKNPVEVLRLEGQPGDYLGTAFGSAGDLGDDSGEVPDGTHDVLLASSSTGRVFALAVPKATPKLPDKVTQAALFMRSAAAAGTRASGKLKTKISNDRATFSMSFRRLPTTGTFTLFLESGVGSGRFIEIGQVTGNAGSLDLEGLGGLPVEFGTYDFASLGGRLVELRDEFGVVVLSTVMPYSTQPRKEKTALGFRPAVGSPFPNATAEGRVTLNSRTGADALTVTVKGVPRGEGLSLWGETKPGSDDWTRIGDFVNGRIVIKTRRDDGVDGLGGGGLRSAIGRALDIRNTVGQSVAEREPGDGEPQDPGEPEEVVPRPDFRTIKLSLRSYEFGVLLDDHYVVKADVRNRGDADAGTLTVLTKIEFVAIVNPGEDDFEIVREAHESQTITTEEFPAGVRHDDVVLAGFDDVQPEGTAFFFVKVEVTLDPDSTGGSGQYVESDEGNNTKLQWFEWYDDTEKWERIVVPPGL